MPVTTTAGPMSKAHAALLTAVAVVLFSAAVGVSGLHYRLLRLRMP